MPGRLGANVEPPTMGERPVAVSQWGMVSGGRRRRYLKLQPREREAGSLPVVLDMHGSGITPEDHVRITSAWALASEAVVIVPQAATPFDILDVLPFTVTDTLPPATAWNIPGTALPGEAEARSGADGVDEVSFVGDLIDELVERHRIDAARIHVRGYSGGARLASHLAAKYPDRIASICCVAGVRFPAEPAPDMPPLLAIHGRRDPLNAFAGGSGAHWQESVESVVGRWAEHDRCVAHSREIVTDGVEMTRYMRADGFTPVRLVVIDQAEHSWPGTADERHAAIFGNPGAFSASAAHWQFVQEIDSAGPR